MTTQNKENRPYIAPEIERVALDNEISLILESTPPTGPNEGYLKSNDRFNNDPFKQLA